MTWNPVWGCLNHCEYCYARKIAKRFAGVMARKETRYRFCLDYNQKWFTWAKTRLNNFEPIFLDSQYHKKFPKKPQRIFVGSMSEIAYWDEVWIQKVIDKTKEYPQHTFIFLTKHPKIYNEWVFPENCGLGVTITNNQKEGEPGRWDFWEYKQHNINNLKFVCYEPLLTGMQLMYYQTLEYIDWVIIGSETGNRKGKVIPSRAWVEDIKEECKMRNIPIYLKDSLKNIYPVEIKEFPKEEN